MKLTIKKSPKEGKRLMAIFSDPTGKKKARKKSFCARMSGVKGPMKDKKGRPTRLKLALKAWGFGSEEAAANFCKRHKKKK